MINEEKLNQISEAASQRCSGALSKLIDTEIGVIFSKPIITNVKEVSPLIGSQELGVGVHLPITGDVTGSSLFLFPNETSFKLCDLAMKRDPSALRPQDDPSRGQLSSFDEGVLKEIGNILLGNYLAVLSNNLKGEITEGMPNFSSGMFGAIIEEVIANFAKGNSKALVVKIELTVKAMRMKGYLLLIFKPEEIEALLNAL
ncbi:MAG: chemotaxis protein CheC [Candidatus Omnitrophota bacterium]